MRIHWLLVVVLACTSVAQQVPDPELVGLTKKLAAANANGDLAERMAEINGVYLRAKWEGYKELAAQAANSLGSTFSRLGDQRRARIWYQRVFDSGTPDQARIAGTLNNFAITSKELGLYTEAEDYSRRSLALRAPVLEAANASLAAAKDDPARARAQRAVTQAQFGFSTSYNQLGNALTELGHYAEALDALQKSLRYRRLAGQPLPEAGSHEDIGILLLRTGQTVGARNEFLTALDIQRQVIDAAGADQREALRNRSQTLFNLAMAYKDEAPEVAVGMLKESVNLIQRERQSLLSLRGDIQVSFRDANRDPYRELAGLLFRLGRIGEGQRVLDMLKEEESFSFMRGDPGTPLKVIDRTSDEDGWWGEWSKVQDEEGRLLFELDQLRQKQDPTGDEKIRLAQLESQAKALVSKRDATIARIQSEFGNKPHVFSQDDVDELQSLVTKISKDDHRPTAALRVFVTRDAVFTILVTSDAPLVYRQPVKIEKFREAVSDLSQSLRDPSLDPTLAGKRVFDIVFKRADAELERRKITQVLCSLDDVLRYIPLAALYDGHGYLGERYDLTYFSPLRLENLSRATPPDWNVAGFAASKAAGYDPLPSAGREVDSIVRAEGEREGMLPGSQFIDATFTSAALEDAIKGHRQSVLHFATHFVLSSVPEACFLVAGDGSPVSIGTIKSWATTGAIFRGVDLIYLSACNTADVTASNSVDGHEVDSFADFAILKGAGTVLASIWRLNDDSGSRLAEAFYRVHMSNPKMGLNQVIRQAQMETRMSTGAGSEVSRAGSTSAPSKSSAGIPLFKPDPAHPYSHPFYWAPIVLYGSYR